jgi:hypothetical protein
MQASVGTVLSRPLGFGLGAVGLATRVNTGDTKGAAKFVDGGYFDILLTYGIAGTLLMLMAVWKIWKQLKLRYKTPVYCTDHVLLARALMLSLLVTCFAGNFLNGFSVLWLAMGTGLAVRAVGPVGRRAETGKLNRSAAEIAEGKPEGFADDRGRMSDGRRRRPGSLLAAGYAAAHEEELARQADPPPREATTA